MNLKQFGDVCHLFVLKFLGILKQKYLEVDDFMLAAYKQAVANYQRNHVHDGNFQSFMNTFIDCEAQNLQKVYKASCKLFEQCNWLVQLRTKFLEVLGEAQGFQ